jgi:hypothetical protein
VALKKAASANRLKYALIKTSANLGNMVSMAAASLFLHYFSDSRADSVGGWLAPRASDITQIGWRIRCAQQLSVAFYLFWAAPRYF